MTRDTLYLKNLNPKVTEEDLVSLFARFQREEGPKIVFRLMKGRMKGQAFVTFEGAIGKLAAVLIIYQEKLEIPVGKTNDPETATKALNLVNGYQLNGKPLIIQYGRQSGPGNNTGNKKTTDRGLYEKDRGLYEKDRGLYEKDRGLYEKDRGLYEKDRGLYEKDRGLYEKDRGLYEKDRGLYESVRKRPRSVRKRPTEVSVYEKDRLRSHSVRKRPTEVSVYEKDRLRSQCTKKTD
ncbi:hypothetical protein QZH41_014318 [Actinostola sp. cb2023]|nr:hypothetical protein QZH41_014318 [Actinostola sp. cb2023]